MHCIRIKQIYVMEMLSIWKVKKHFVTKGGCFMPPDDLI